MDLNGIEYFVKAAETLNFTRAANECQITQTAMSQHISNMEGSLGFRLFDRTTRKVALTPAGEALSMTEQQYAAIATAPMLVGVFISFLSGTLGDRIGVKKTVFAALVITTVGAVARAFVPSYGTLLLVTVLMGVAGTVLNSNNAKLMSAWFSPEQLGLAIGIVVAAGNGGTILAMMIGKGLSPDVSTAFLYGGVVFAVLTVLWLIFVKEKKTEIPEAGTGPEVGLGDVLKSKYTWVAAVGAALYMGVNLSVSALMSPGLVAKGVSDGAASMTIIIFSLVALTGSVVMPGVIGKQRNTKIVCAVLSVVAGVALYMGWKADSAAVRNLLIVICAVCLGGLLPTIMSIPAILPEIGPVKMGAAGGLISTVMMAGAFLIPSYVITPIAGGINDMTFLLSAACSGLLAVIFMILPNASTK